MNKKLGLAVAGALLALSSTANAGITIPAGDWTLDISGNVNAYYNSTKSSGGPAIAGGVATARDSLGDSRAQGINTGLLPAWIGFTGKSRQNDLDIEFAISFQPAVSANDVSGDGAFSDKANQGDQILNRQTYVSFGDKSWGSIKLGKDLGVFASDAILNDMTLLGVGSAAGRSGSTANTTNGGIGTGYIYAAWKGQIAYTSPNWNGFQFTAAVTNPNQGFGTGGVEGLTVNQDRLGMEAKASYSWTGDVAGKVWVSGASYDVQTATANRSYKANVWDIGTTVNVAGFGLTGYYYQGEGAGTTLLGLLGYNATTDKRRDSDGGYVQATYVIPTGTKLGVAYGVSNLDRASGESATGLDLIDKNRRYTVGAYHPLTKSLNLVAEYNDIESESHNPLAKDAKSKTVSLGAILFF